MRHCLNETNLGELALVHGEHLARYQRSTPLPQNNGYLVVDMDQTGLVANSKSYRLACKGYFAKRTGLRGYQMASAYLGSSEVTLSMHLAPGNTHCSS